MNCGDNFHIHAVERPISEVGKVNCSFQLEPSGHRVTFMT